MKLACVTDSSDKVAIRDVPAERSVELGFTAKDQVMIGHFLKTLDRDG